MEKKKQDDDRPKKLPFMQRLRTAFNGVSRKEMAAVFKDTLKDLKKPKEIGMIIAGGFVPGGWIAYGVYRIAKYRHKKAANENKPPENNQDAKPPQPGLLRLPKPPRL
jgi:hypothetical protein